MSRPRTINKTGNTRITSVLLSEPVYDRLKEQAKQRGVTLGAVIRERLGDGT